ncbi:unnamed protein product [Meganyctiphanes norvegica]|uniref:Uncharacterized protein n=1 Tax=Meganyctiphanes norvegica TaxID=48144 RepID=A0AAV2S9A3_MEGNR
MMFTFSVFIYWDIKCSSTYIPAVIYFYVTAIQIPVKDIVLVIIIIHSALWIIMNVGTISRVIGTPVAGDVGAVGELHSGCGGEQDEGPDEAEDCYWLIHGRSHSGHSTSPTAAPERTD